METASTNENTGKGAMWELEKSLDRPMDVESRRLRNVYTEKDVPQFIIGYSDKVEQWNTGDVVKNLICAL
ncbi:Potassium transporter 18 [Hordeum vulgare]|nr:Potassium transporter 18 [Hordeum vulgare]